MARRRQQQLRCRPGRREERNREDEVDDDCQHQPADPDLCPAIRVIQQEVALSRGAPTHVAAGAQRREQEPDEQIGVEGCLDDSGNRRSVHLSHACDGVHVVREGIDHDGGGLQPAPQVEVPPHHAVPGCTKGVVETWSVAQDNRDCGKHGAWNCDRHVPQRRDVGGPGQRPREERGAHDRRGPGHVKATGSQHRWRPRRDRGHEVALEDQDARHGTDAIQEDHAIEQSGCGTRTHGKLQHRRIALRIRVPRGDHKNLQRKRRHEAREG
mmetsp:Transcript_104999/g.321722  ORF Transcript_104999/g.321722 Transcript_104999/m.321722 type:complete len:269 (+) Transcript_104999:296-1102(+)